MDSTFEINDLSFIKKFDQFLPVLFNNRARLWKIIPTLLPKKKSTPLFNMIKKDLVTNSIYKNFRNAL